jgi:hypothetical protein
MRACVSACASTFLVCTDKVMVAGVGDFVVNSYVHPVMRILQLSATPVPLISSVYGGNDKNTKNDTVASHLSRTAMGRSACFALARPPPHAFGGAETAATRGAV